MSVEDFSTTLVCLMRVCWAAAAGQLHLASGNEDEEEGTVLKAGICGQNKTATGKVWVFSFLFPLPSISPPPSPCFSLAPSLPQDAGIARESLELLATCLKLRSSLLNEFYSLPLVEEFVIDVLLGSAHPDIRSALVQCFNDLCVEIGMDYDPPSAPEEPQQAKRPRSAPIEPPHHFFLHLLLSNPSSLWQDSPSSSIDREVWGRSSQYFDFLNLLLSQLSSE